MIRVENLTKHFRQRVAVNNLTFSVEPGWVTGFLGPNGAGKSTTLRLILGLDSPTSGRATINGVPYVRLRNPLTMVGALLDTGSAHRARTARHHLLWMAQSNAIATRRVDEVLEIVGLSSVAKTRVGTFSLGMGQRLGIAAALLGDPQVLILDEPVNGLDPEGILWIRTFLKDLAAQGKTVLVSSHLMSEIAQTADHLIVIGDGRLRAEGKVSDVVAGYASLEEAFLNLTSSDAQYRALPAHGA